MIIEKRAGPSSAVLLGILLLITFAVRVESAPGDLDLTFGNSGKVVSDLGVSDLTQAVGLLPDERIVVATESHLAIFSAGGTLDQVFGQTGDRYRGVAVQPDGKIVTVGDFHQNRYDCEVVRVHVRRFNSDGTPDTSFGVYSGLTIYSAGCVEDGNRAWADDIVLYGGKIVVAGGTREDNGASKFLALRLNTNGAFDTSFNNDGVGKYPIAESAKAYAVAVQPRSGRIVLAGYSSPASPESQATLLMLRADGHPDWSFGSFGVVTTEFLQYDTFETVAFQSDGRVVAGGSAGNQKGTIGRYNTDGSLDTSFSFDGKVVIDIAHGGGINRVRLQPDGKILAAASGIEYFFGQTHDFLLYRFNADGSHDLSLVRITDFDGGKDTCTSMAVQSDGKIVLVGYTDSDHDNYGHDIALARYMP